VKGTNTKTRMICGRDEYCWAWSKTEMAIEGESELSLINWYVASTNNTKITVRRYSNISESIIRVWSEIFESYLRRPMSKNSALDWLRECLLTSKLCWHLSCDTLQSIGLVFLILIWFILQNIHIKYSHAEINIKYALVCDSNTMSRPLALTVINLLNNKIQ